MDNLHIKTFTIPQGAVHVIDEGSKYPYGTKQRISAEYVAEMKNRGYNEFVYAGPVNGMGAFALAHGCVQNNVKATLFLVGTKMSPQACGFPKSVVNIRLMKCPLAEAETAAKDYVKQSPTRYLVPFGIKDTLYTSLLKKALQDELGCKDLSLVKRMWLAVGSGTILAILLQIFPNTVFHCVQVGKSLRINELSEKPEEIADYQRRIVLYSSPERFTHPAEIMPPYSSLENYDAKIWRFVLSYGQDGDYIWNVAGNPRPRSK